MGTDRLANLAGAAHMFGHPALVFDGGTAATYSATDWKGRILGGGIGPGIRTKFKAMAESTANLPDVSEMVYERVGSAMEGSGPLPVFATNTEDAMMGDVFRELALKGRNVIATWLERGYRGRKLGENVKFNAEKRVVCTGGDGEILQLLLSPDSGGLVEIDEQKSQEYEVEVSKHLIHYGICAVLCRQSKLQQRKMEFAKTSDEEHVGKRVAKVFDVEADDGDNVYRGTVKEVAIVDGKKEFRVAYDDGDVDDVSDETLFGELLDHLIVKI
jgi:hypothetical protein